MARDVPQTKEMRPFGLWDSPITPASIARGIRLEDAAWDSDGDTLVWLENRSGKGVLVCSRGGGAPNDLPGDLSVRAGVGYGGGDFTVAGGAAYFVSGGRLYRQALSGGGPVPLTPAFGDLASPAVSPNGQWVVFVHSYEGQDCLAVVDTAGRHWPQRLVTGADFYMQPCWHPAGERIAWISWNHPHMPWDGTRLHLATLRFPDDGLPVVSAQTTLAGGDEIAVFQPEFSPDGLYLAYASDQTGWFHVYLYDMERGTHRPLTADEADYGTAAWQQGMRTHAFGRAGADLYAIREQAGFARLWRFDLRRGTSEAVGGALQPYTALSQIAASPARDEVALLASSSDTPPRLITCSVGAAAEVRVHRRSRPEGVGALPRPQAITWPSACGETVHGLLYMPASERFSGAGSPPAVIYVHGGPTSRVRAEFRPEFPFFTSRGYAVLAVNHRGSTGYGRPYRDALKGHWGVHDVEDSVAGARHLVEAGLADPGRLVILGGSAGGFTVLQALATHPGFFKAGVCLYGISNLLTLAADTHKFESRYLDSLVGPLPEVSAVYRERSPIFHADRIRDPLAIFQGTDDRVVPRDQSDAIVESLRRRGVPHEYHVYEGEGHGWRRAETVEAYYRAVESFLRKWVIFA